jgi:hypothetical protein
MTKCCKYSVPGDPEHRIFVIPHPDGVPCTRFAAYQNEGYYTVPDGSSCTPPPPKPKFRCCVYGKRYPFLGRTLAAFKICLPATVKCPRIPGYILMKSTAVASCRNCCGPIKQTTLHRLARAKLTALARKKKISAKRKVSRKTRKSKPRRARR